MATASSTRCSRLPRAARPAVRLLHAWHRDGCGALVAGEPDPTEEEIRHGARGQSLPLHGLPEHRPRRTGGGQGPAHDPCGLRLRRAESVEQALELLSGDEDAKLLAGGHSLVPAMRLRLARPSLLVDIGRLDDLRYVRDEGDTIAIGALTRHAALTDDETLGKRCPLIATAAGHVGDPQVRHRGTIGGAVAHADPASDYGMVLLTLDADLVIQGPGGERTVPIAEFFHGPFMTALGQNELLTEIRVPAVAGGIYSRRAPRTGLGDGRRRGTGERIRARRLAGMGGTPLRATAVEQALAGGASRPRRPSGQPRKPSLRPTSRARGKPRTSARACSSGEPWTSCRRLT